MELPKLNFKSQFDFKLRQDKDKFFIYDVLRKSWLLLTPEEWVRQHWIHYFISCGKAISALVPERQIEVGHTIKRIDLMVLSKTEIEYLLEFKASRINLSQKVFEQVARYNSVIKANNIIVSNGLQHIFAKFENDQYQFYQKEV